MGRWHHPASSNFPRGHFWVIPAVLAITALALFALALVTNRVRVDCSSLRVLSSPRPADLRARSFGHFGEATLMELAVKCESGKSEMSRPAGREAAAKACWLPLSCQSSRRQTGAPERVYSSV